MNDTRTERYFAELSDAERIYEQVKAKLSAAERQSIADLRARRLNGDERAYYGHDLHGAIARAKRRESVDQAREFIRSEYVRGNVFAAIGLLVTAAVQEDISAEKIKRALSSALECADYFAIDQQVERWREGCDE